MMAGKSPSGIRSPQLGLLVIVFFALAIRIFVAFQTDTSAFMAVDGRDYREIAENLSAGRGFAASHYRWFEAVPPNAPATHPDMYRPPLLPLVGAGLFALPGDWMVWARISMVVLGLAVVAFVYSLGKALFGISAGLLAAGLIAMDPFAAHYAATWSTETPFALCLLAGVTFLVWARQSDRPIHYAAAGISLGLASLARPTGLVIGGGLVVWLSRSRRRVGRVPAFLTVLLPMMIVVAPWAARNASITGAPNPGTFFGPYNLWLGNNHRMYELYSAGESRAFAPLLDSLYSEDSKEHVRALQSAGIFDVTASNNYWLREARRYLVDKPKEAASIFLHRCIHFIRPWPNRTTTGPLDFWASLLWIGPLMGLAVLSLIRRPSARDPVLLLPILFGFLVGLPFIFHLRFRFPVFDCYLAVISAPAILDVAHSLRVRQLFGRRAPGRRQFARDMGHPNNALEQTASVARPWQTTSVRLAVRGGPRSGHRPPLLIASVSGLMHLVDSTPRGITMAVIIVIGIATGLSCQGDQGCPTCPGSSLGFSFPTTIGNRWTYAISGTYGYDNGWGSLEGTRRDSIEAIEFCGQLGYSRLVARRGPEPYYTPRILLLSLRSDSLFFIPPGESCSLVRSPWLLYAASDVPGTERVLERFCHVPSPGDSTYVSHSVVVLPSVTLTTALGRFKNVRVCRYEHIFDVYWGSMPHTQSHSTLTLYMANGFGIIKEHGYSYSYFRNSVREVRRVGEGWSDWDADLTGYRPARSEASDAR